jgi:hypothetical protein
MRGVRDRVTESLKTLGLIVQRPQSRRQSLDDYFILDNQRSSQPNQWSDLFHTSQRYMNDLRQYEQVRSELRYMIWQDRKNQD